MSMKPICRGERVSGGATHLSFNVSCATVRRVEKKRGGEASKGADNCVKTGRLKKKPADDT